MANFSVAPTASVVINGITPAAGPLTTDKVNASYAPSSTTADDRINETFTVNANTTATAIDLGKIVTGKYLWLECNGPLHVTLTQDLGAGAVDIVVRVEKFLCLQSPFTALKVANPSATTAVNMSVIVAGDRLPVGGGPGVF